jgi:DNA polymerase
MASAHRRLLEAAIEHLEELKSAGVQFVDVRPETLAALTRPAPRPRASGVPPNASFSPGLGATPPSAVPASANAPSALNPAWKQPATAASSSAAPAPALPASAPLDPEAKAAAFQELRERALCCVKCPDLASSRRSVVFGVGNIDADLMFVGEAPGMDEDAQGEPFVGAAGQLLNKIIGATGLTREQVYIANILKCRPDTPGQRTGNRKPTPSEMETCIPYLHEQIDLIRPKVIVALGGTAIEGLLGPGAGISRLRGRWQTYRGIPLMPTFHPSYLLRTQSPATEKRKVWEDMLAVMEKLGLPISEKQRGYFQPAAR